VAPTTVLAGETDFWTRLSELGWIEGKTIAVKKYFAEADRSRLPELMKQALQFNPDVLVTPGTPGALAAKRATTTVPIVALMGDPVGSGLVPSLSRPGGNLTGMSVQNAEEIPVKWIELLRELLPQISRIAVVVDPGHPVGKVTTAQLNQAASAVQVKIIVFEARRPEDFVRIVQQARQQAQALIVQPSDLAIHSRRLIATQAEKHRLPVLYAMSDFVEAGGLISYGSDLAVLWRRIGDYVDRVLKGASPAALPIEQPLAFDLVINLSAAKAINVTVPRTLLERADRVVQ
jgi:putative ABC transport system substrate-binding protein